MKHTTAKEYLCQVRHLKFKALAIREELERLEQGRILISAVAYDKEPVQTSGDGQGFTRKSDYYVDLTAKARAQTKEYDELRNRIVDEILSLSDSRASQILYMAYVDDYALKWIADSMHLSYSHVKNVLHPAALELFEKEVLGSGHDTV